MPARSAAAILSKRWDLLAEYKDQYWRDSKKLGIQEALRVVGALRAQAQLFNPEWPTEKDSEDDLETHIRVATALARTAPRRPGHRTTSAQQKRKQRHPTRTARRTRRVRRSR